MTCRETMSRHLTSQEAGLRLGVSPITVNNWLEGGHFPGAYQARNGQWLFPLDDVAATEARINRLHIRNRRRDIQPADTDYELRVRNLSVAIITNSLFLASFLVALRFWSV